MHTVYQVSTIYYHPKIRSRNLESKKFFLDRLLNTTVIVSFNKYCKYLYKAFFHAILLPENNRVTRW
jgi:hypothetical protein